MRINSLSYAVANVTNAFGGTGAPGLQGSNFNIAESVLTNGPGQLGNGGSTDMGGGGGGTSGGGGSGARAPGGGSGLGGFGGTGGMSGGSGTVGGPGPHTHCQKKSTPPSSDPDDSLEPANPSPEDGSSGPGNGDQAPIPNNMPPGEVNPCLGGPGTTKKRRGSPTCSNTQSTI